MLTSDQLVIIDIGKIENLALWLLFIIKTKNLCYKKINISLAVDTVISGNGTIYGK